MKTSKTIFDYYPTKEELIELFQYDEAEDAITHYFSLFSVPINRYDKSPKEKLMGDIAALLEYRNKKEEAAKIWKDYPDLKQEYDMMYSDNPELRI